MRTYLMEVIHRSDWTYRLLGSGIVIPTIHAEIARDGEECWVLDLVSVQRHPGEVVRRFVESVRASHRKTGYEIVSMDRERVLALLSSECSDSVRERINSARIPVLKSLVRSGVEVYEILARDWDHARQLARKLREISEPVGLKALGRSPESGRSLVERILSKREREILGTALAKGFFNSPKGAGTEDIARIYGVSKAYISMTLRRAVKKILEHALNSPTLSNTL